MKDTEFQELVALYALGSLEPQEAARVELYLKNNPSAQATYLWYLESVAVLAQSAPQSTPPSALKTELKRRVKALNRQKLYFLPPMLSGWFWRRLELAPWLSAAVLVTAFGLLLINIQHKHVLQIRTDEMRQLEVLLGSRDTQFFLMQAPNSQTVVGRVLIGADHHMVISHKMGILPNTKTWQAWYIKKGQSTPISLGTTTEAHLMLVLPSDAVVVAVSEEPIGGSTQPTLIRGMASL